jgi:hypothetical protein
LIWDEKMMQLGTLDALWQDHSEAINTVGVGSLWRHTARSKLAPSKNISDFTKNVRGVWI